MEIEAAVRELYPALEQPRDFEVRTRSDGTTYLYAWTNSNPRPTDAQLAEAWFRAAKKQKKAEGANRMHRENRAVYSEVQEAEGAWVAEAMIDLITEPRGARVAAIKANRDKRARFYASIDAAPSVEAVRALAWEGA